MTRTAVERRVQRSANPADALASWLEASRQRGNLRSLALADRLGILVAGAGPARECDELAAWAPLVLEGGSEEPAIELSGVKLPGFDAYVCTAGKLASDFDLLLETAEGCARILGRPARAA